MLSKAWISSSIKARIVQNITAEDVDDDSCNVHSQQQQIGTDLSFFTLDQYEALIALF